MTRQREDIEILLIQARDEHHMLEQELDCFAERCRLKPSQFRRANVVNGPLTTDVLNGVDGIVIGGAGRYSAVQDYHWMPSLLTLVRDIHSAAIPLFGSCWGHQIIARAFGGEVVHDLAGAELGCFGVELTAVGRADPIFGRLPHTFLTNMGHHDRVTRLPESAVELARNASQPNQALRIRDRPIYGTQFHSELNAERERERLYEYRNEYRTALPSDEHFDHVIASLAETTEADALLSHFIDEFVLQ